MLTKEHSTNRIEFFFNTLDLSDLDGTFTGYIYQKIQAFTLFNISKTNKYKANSDTNETRGKSIVKSTLYQMPPGVPIPITIAVHQTSISSKNTLISMCIN